MKITLYPYRLEFVFPFRIAHGTRTHTDAVFVELEQDGVRAFGEATFPPYLPYNQTESMALLGAMDLSGISIPYNVDAILWQLKKQFPDTNNPPAFAAVEMALWTLKAKLENTRVGDLLEIKEAEARPSFYTIAVCDKAEMAARLQHGISKGFRLFKLKLDGKSDKQMLEDYRSLSDALFAVDANQAWTDIDEAISFAYQLQDHGCILIEQPFHRDDLIMTAALRSHLYLQIVADEACQGYDDIERISQSFDGINIKLQKCGGISNGLKMINRTRELNMKVLIGCMSESAIGCGAAEHIAPLCDWNDLDGKYLVREVPFRN